MRRTDVRNIAIIAHVDHGKTTLVDCLLRQSGEFRASQLVGDCILDSNDLERERGITILAKNIALHYQGVKINLIDTPGHADFGGEVERVLRMADGALVLVDAAEGPMPQTRYVLSKALECRLQPIVVVNKIDRPDARPHEVLNESFELLMDLGGEHILSDFPHIFASSKEGFATHDPDKPGESMRPLFDMMLEAIPGPEIDAEAPLQMLVTNLDWSDYVGRIAVGRIYSGTIRSGQQVALMQAAEPSPSGRGQGEGDSVPSTLTPTLSQRERDSTSKLARVAEVHVFDKLGRCEVEEATAGDIAALVGLDDVTIGDTVSDPQVQRALPRVAVDEPTIQMVFSINNSPFAGREGKYVTSQHLAARLRKELERNVALRVEPMDSMDSFQVFGRGVLHLSVLIETMRREGYELAIGKPHVVLHKKNGVTEEPFESLVVEVPHEKLGPVMELVGARRGQLIEMTAHDNYTYVVFSIPARGLIGLRTRLLNATQGTAVIHHRFERFAPMEGEVPDRPNGVLVSMVPGRVNAYALDTLQERSELFVAPGDEVYEGMIVGENSRSEDMAVNPTKEKKLTNIRAAGSDKNILLKPPRDMSLETALEYIEEDELVEVTPGSIRLRKRVLKEADRRRLARQGA
ncbi:MAG TPA: GTP-binding protein [Lacipirellulaceae bacterium]|nr:GTP-binding protein [Lacipirellulaceae bacterium]